MNSYLNYRRIICVDMTDFAYSICIRMHPYEVGIYNNAHTYSYAAIV